MAIKFYWSCEEYPGWDSTGTVVASWTETVGEYVCRIDRFAEGDGGGYAYSVSVDGDYIRNGENMPAESFELAEDAIRHLLADRV